MLTIRLNQEQERAVDLLARTHNQTKSEFVRGLIDNAIGEMRHPASIFQEIREFSKTVKVKAPLDIKALIEDGRP